MRVAGSLLSIIVLVSIIGCMTSPTVDGWHPVVKAELTKVDALMERIKALKPRTAPMNAEDPEHSKATEHYATLLSQARGLTQAVCTLNLLPRVPGEEYRLVREERVILEKNVSVVEEQLAARH